MPHRPRSVALLLIGVAGVGGLVWSLTRAAAERPLSADPVFAARFKDFNRTMQPLGQWRGKPTVVYFWATWCEPCRHEVPALIKLYEKYRSKDLVVVGIAVDQTDKVQGFVGEYGISYPILIGGNDALDLSRRMGNGIGGLPFLVVIDRKGRVTATQLGEFPDARLEAMVAPLVGS